MTDRKNGLGLYLHIPFCAKKCAYCDFYSAFVSDNLLETYVLRLAEEIKMWGGKLNRPIINSVYLGGGTPSLLGAKILPLMQSVRSAFDLAEDSEITLELNPDSGCENILKAAKQAGVNRISVGAQSGDNRILSLLGRTHTAKDTLTAVKAARNAGFDNISLDLMIGLPFSDNETLKKDLDFILSAKPEHISAYILKIEENTLFYKTKDSLNLPDEDKTADQYLFMCDYLKKNGFRHYEISNFCLDGKTSRHNLKYWNCEEYLGIGPSAHSFLNGKRFYYPRDIKVFLKGNEPTLDGTGGDEQEYIMLCLRLEKGLEFEEFRKKFGKPIPQGIIKAAKPLEKAGLINLTDKKISLTDRGMLVSNSIITELLENSYENT